MRSSHAQTYYDGYPTYSGNDLGLTYSASSSTFRIWSPPASRAELLFFKSGESKYPYRSIEMQKDKEGTWLANVPGNQLGVFYAFKVYIGHQWSHEVPDPYAKACGVNGKKAMVVDLAATNPPGWDKDRSPDFSATNHPVDALIYELHVRDASIHPSSGIREKGKFNGLAELNARTMKGTATGLKHLQSLGVTHIHLLPFFDFFSVDESKNARPQYNWGYDPLHYNIPEGSYSSDPYNGSTRIRELKTMIQAFHNNGLRVVMDVVYNHTGLTEKANFNQLVPGYYYRHKRDGSFSDATACGNETASELPMMRKFIIESLLYWVNEYHIDGFRFDLMGVHDIETMNQAAAALKAVKPDILLYGEGWTAGQSPLPDSMRALKTNVSRLNGIAVFSDDIRDAIKGSVFDAKDRGFASGKFAAAEKLKQGIVASCNHHQLSPTGSYASSPAGIISYCECHDNNTLWDKLELSNPEDPESERRKMHKLALSIVLTSQGTPFLHAGTEMYRSKQGVENSYKSPDSINAINWNMLDEHEGLVNYVRSLIQLRKAHPAFRLQTAQQLNEVVQFINHLPEGLLGYTLNGKKCGDSWGSIAVYFNATATAQVVQLPDGFWEIALSSEKNSGTDVGLLKIAGRSAVILYQP